MNSEGINLTLKECEFFWMFFHELALQRIKAAHRVANEFSLEPLHNKQNGFPPGTGRMLRWYSPIAS